MPEKLTERLHDEIDMQEDFREEIQNLIADLKTRDMARIVNNIESLDGVFSVLSAVLANSLADITTRAVRAGFDAERRRDGD